MPINANTLVFTAADYKIVLISPSNAAYPLLTAEGMGWSNAREEETVYAIGTSFPIAAKTNAINYKGKLSLQMGELNAILQLEGLVTGDQLQNCTLAITAISGALSRTYSGVVFYSEGLDIKNKDKQSVANLEWTALAVA